MAKQPVGFSIGAPAPHPDHRILSSGPDAQKHAGVAAAHPPSEETKAPLPDTFDQDFEETLAHEIARDDKTAAPENNQTNDPAQDTATPDNQDTGTDKVEKTSLADRLRGFSTRHQTTQQSPEEDDVSPQDSSAPQEQETDTPEQTAADKTPPDLEKHYHALMASLASVYGDVVPVEEGSALKNILVAFSTRASIKKPSLLTSPLKAIFSKSLLITPDKYDSMIVTKKGVHLKEGLQLTNDNHGYEQAFIMAMPLYLNPDAHKYGVTLEGTSAEKQILQRALEQVMDLNPDIPRIKIHNPVEIASEPEPEPAEETDTEASPRPDSMTVKRADVPSQPMVQEPKTPRNDAEANTQDDTALNQQEQVPSLLPNDEEVRAAVEDALSRPDEQSAEPPMDSNPEPSSENTENLSQEEKQAFLRAAEHVVMNQDGTQKGLREALGVNAPEARKLIQELQRLGFVGELVRGKGREVLVSPKDVFKRALNASLEPETKPAESFQHKKANGSAPEAPHA